ncbi:DUF3035 domain-containing protein [Salipiger sp.]|uniref:DUF3035 domain-containing protein n=1 Tax=Salipiger sp. TaxID=2078585 RepID=UPI003A97EEA0
MKLAQIVLMVGLVGLSACSSRDRAPGETSLHQLRSNSGTPEEFAIVPNKPLVQPPSYKELPAPTPGAANRGDQTPLSDAVAALGGNPARLVPGAVPAGDSALVNRASRYGRDAGIRTELAQTDLAFRERKQLFSWKLFPDDEYIRAYRREALDPYYTLGYFRSRGVRTPSAPPEGY